MTGVISGIFYCLCFMIVLEGSRQCKSDLCFLRFAIAIQGSTWVMMASVILGVILGGGQRALTREGASLWMVLVSVHADAEEAELNTEDANHIA